MPLALTAPIADIFAKCTPVYGLGSQRCGGLTLMDLSATTGLDIESIYRDEDGNYRILGALLESDFLGKSCQIRQNTLYDFLMATARTWGTKKIGIDTGTRGRIEVNPFVKMARTGIINANYWNVTLGSAVGGTSPGGVVYTHTFVLESQTSIPADVRWFSPRSEVFIHGKSAGGLATHTQWTVLDALVLTDSTIRIYAKSVNLNSSLIAGKRELPVIGVATRGVPNVNDYESYCNEIPGINANQRALFWIGDTRWSICVDQETEKLLKMVRDGNALFRDFGDVESVVLNQQILADFQRRLVESFFWAKPLEHQNVNDWAALEPIGSVDGANITDYLYLPNITGRVIGRRANAVGMYEQLAECGRVKDLAGENLNLYELFAELYTMKRTREDNNILANIIEVYTNSSYAVVLRQGLFRYLNARYEGALRANFDISSTTKTLPNGFTFTDVPLEFPAGLTLRIVTHMAFDDILDAHARAGAGLEATGRTLIILDIGNTAYMSVIESNSQTNTTGDISALSAVNQDILCRMKVPRTSVTMKSMKYVFVLECPGASLWIENIGSGIPEHCGPTGDATDLAGDIVAEELV